MDYRFAKYIAYERLRDVLLESLTNAQLAARIQRSTQDKKVLFKWTGDAINLVELAYGIWLTGQLNHGNAGIAEIMLWLETNLQVNIGRPFRRWHVRKHNLTTPLVQMTNNRFGFGQLDRVVTMLRAADRPLDNATTFLWGFGHIVVAWLWLDQAVAARGLSDPGDFGAGKMRACRFFFECELPKVAAWLDFVETGSDVSSEAPVAIFGS